MTDTQTNFRRLDAVELVETIRMLQGQIERRVPGPGLGGIAVELLQVAQETVARTDWNKRPHQLLRRAAGVLSVLFFSIVAGLVLHLRQFQFSEYDNFIQALDASMGSMVFIGADILFLVSWENRIKRNRTLKGIHELRALAHIADMHQWTKDPENPFGSGHRPAAPRKPAMTPFELNRMDSLKQTKADGWAMLAWAQCSAVSGDWPRRPTERPEFDGTTTFKITRQQA